MTIDFTGKSVLVTGDSRGIGKAIYDAFKQCGAQVFGWNKKDMDLSNPDLIDSILSEHPPLITVDILVNCAGINIVNSFEETELFDVLSVMEINTFSPFILCKHYSKKMIANKWGRIVNIASIYGTITKEGRLAYTTSKAALIGMTKTLALELAPHNVLVNSVSPGFTETDMTRNSLGEDDMKNIVENVPIKRLLQPEEIAKTVLFLCSEHNTAITGQDIKIDGGYANT